MYKRPLCEPKVKASSFHEKQFTRTIFWYVKRLNCCDRKRREQNIICIKLGERSLFIQNLTSSHNYLHELQRLFCIYLIINEFILWHLEYRTIQLQNSFNCLVIFLNRLYLFYSHEVNSIDKNQNIVKMQFEERINEMDRLIPDTDTIDDDWSKAIWKLRILQLSGFSLVSEKIAKTLLFDRRKISDNVIVLCRTIQHDSTKKSIRE